MMAHQEVSPLQEKCDDCVVDAEHFQPQTSVML